MSTAAVARPRFTFDPAQVAYLEAAGWRAYYDRKWPKMLSLMLRMSREEFKMPRFAAGVAAYYTVQASRAWAPRDSDWTRAREYLARFYRLARMHSGLVFDPVRACAAELAYWDIARRLKSGAPRQDFVRVMTDLHSEV